MQKLNNVLKHILVLMLFSTSLTPQVTIFEKTYGGSGNDRAYSLKKTSDNGYILTGYTYSYGAGGKDIYVVKTDSVGDTLWTKTYGGSQEDEGRDIIEIIGEGYFILCQSNSSGNHNLLKIDYFGNIIWSKSITGEYNQIKSINSAPNEFILCGEYSGEFCVTRINSLGDTLWLRSYNPTSYLEEGKARAIAQLPDNSFIVVGDYYWFSVYSGVHYQVKIDGQGNLQNDLLGSVMGGSRTTNDLALTIDGSIIGGGHYGYSSGITVNDHYFTFFKINPSFTTLWSRSFYLDNRVTACYAVTICENNEYGFAGHRYYNDTDKNHAFMVKTDSSGNTIWTRRLSWYQSFIFSMHSEEDGGFALAGSVKKTGNDDFYLLKTDTLGYATQIIPVNPITSKYDLHQNFPNPFNSTTKIKYTLQKTEKVKIEIFNLLGQKIKVLLDKKMPSGIHEVEFDAKNLPSGIYFYRINSGNYKDEKKMLLLR